MTSYSFLALFGNDPMHNQFTTLLSSTAFTPNRPKGPGTYIYEGNIRMSISLFSVRSLVKSNWQNSNDVYKGRNKKENDLLV